MNIINGKCVICLGNTFVFSGKDKQKFVELLKEHYFDANQINDNKFLLQFKEKRSEKSICICCAYVIECYVNLRNKFQDHKTKNDRKCSICRIGSNLTCGTYQLMKDASTLLKNIHPDNKVGRLTLLCLDCCFCIVSWNKIKDIISKYSEDEPKYIKETSKRKYSLDHSNFNASTEDMNIIPVRRSRRMSVVSERMKQFVATNGTIKQKIITRVHETPRKKKPKLIITLEDQLNHLLTVSEEICSKDICLSDQMKYRVENDDRMMYDIAYIACGTNDEAYSQRKSPRINNKITKSRKRSIYSAEDVEASSDNVSAITGQGDLSQTVSRMTRKRSKIASMNSSVITISDTDSDNADTQQTLRVTRRKRRTPVKRSVISKPNTDCTVCNKHFSRKYKLKLHELEHEVSFTPVVLIEKENICHNIKNYDVFMNEESNDNKDQENNEEIQNKLDNLVKQVVDDALTQIENEIEKNIVNQVVDDTLSQLENKIQGDKEDSFATNNKENNENIEIVNEENNTNSNNTDITEITNIECNEVQLLASEDNVSNTKNIEQLSEDDKINETVTEGSEEESNKLSESNSEINDEKSCVTEDSVIESTNEISNGQIQDDIIVEKAEENILVPNETENSINDPVQTNEICNNDDNIFEETNEISLHNEENENQIEKNIDNSQHTSKTLILNTEREIDEENILHKLENEEENCDENKLKGDIVSTEIEEIKLTDKSNEDNVLGEETSKEVCIEQNDSTENKSNEEKLSSENDECTSQNADRTSNSCAVEEDSGMETLHVSPDLNDNSSPKINIFGINNTQNNADKYEIENILQNLGA